MVTMRPAELADHGEFSAESSGSMEGCGVLPDSVAAEGTVPRGRGRTLRHVSRTRMLILPTVLVLGLGLDITWTSTNGRSGTLEAQIGRAHV